MSTLGTLGLLAAQLLLVFSFGFSLPADPKRGKRFLLARITFYAAGTLIFWCTILLAVAFMMNDFSLRYVVDHSSWETPWYYRLSALWAGKEGSCLLWVLLTLGASTIASASVRTVSFNAYRRFILISSLTATGLLGFTLYAANPFTPRLVPVIDGLGLNPLLRDWAMIVHPPLLFAGYAFLAVVFALAVSDPDERPIANLLARWSRLAGGALTAGIVTGALWAYDELGWGGYWGWDPVENASLLPWLTGFVLIHFSRKNSRRVYRPAVFLAGLAFASSILAAYLTRSGVVFSLHAFADDSSSLFFLIALGGVMAHSLIRGIKASPMPGGTSFALTAGGLMMLLMALAVLVGTLWPIWARMMVDHPQPLAADFYNRVVGTMGLVLLMILAGCTVGRIEKGRRIEALLSTLTVSSVVGFAFWFMVNLNHPGRLAAVVIITANLMLILIDMLWHGREFRRRFPRNLAHLGLAILAAGLTASMAHPPAKPLVLAEGETKAFGTLKVELRELNLEEKDNGRIDVIANLRVTSPDGEVTLHPRQIILPDGKRRVDLDFRTGPISDIYAVLEDFNGTQAMVSVRRNWLVSWVWAGALVLLVACVLAAGVKGRKSC
jgi:cytochrome c-type biogenesis protein CcmF